MSNVSFPGDLESLCRPLVGLRTLQERIPDPTAPAPVRAMAELGPVTAWFPVAGNWTGAITEAKASGVLRSFGKAPVNVPVRGMDKIEAKRRITRVLGLMGIPAGLRSEWADTSSGLSVLSALSYAQLAGGASLWCTAIPAPARPWSAGATRMTARMCGSRP